MDPLRVLSFNVRYDTPADGARAWCHRRDLVAGLVRFHRPDVVGLQEVLAGQLADLRERLPGYEWAGVGREDGHEVGEHVPIGVRTDRVGLGPTTTQWLSETPEVPGSRDPDAAHPRIVTWGTVTDRRTGREATVFNTHLDHEGAAARERGARRVRERVAAVADGSPVVVTGDLNATPGSPPLAVLTGSDGPGDPLADALEAAEYHHGPTATFEQFDGPPDRRIDYVLVGGGVSVAGHATLTDRDDEGVPSDHRPVAADIHLPGSDAE
jgi:endonuclease/exonuclease/phosphatase family metal-dependent hydrolase